LSAGLMVMPGATILSIRSSTSLGSRASSYQGAGVRMSPFRMALLPVVPRRFP
jgi:hypothetical protein